MRKVIRSMFALAFVVGLTPTAARADGSMAAGCLWTYDGCVCSPFGSCSGVNCDHNGTSWCKKNDQT